MWIFNHFAFPHLGQHFVLFRNGLKRIINAKKNITTPSRSGSELAGPGNIRPCSNSPPHQLGVAREDIEPFADLESFGEQQNATDVVGRGYNQPVSTEKLVRRTFSEAPARGHQGRSLEKSPLLPTSIEAETLTWKAEVKLYQSWGTALSQTLPNGQMRKQRNKGQNTVAKWIEVVHAAFSRGCERDQASHSRTLKLVFDEGVQQSLRLCLAKAQEQIWMPGQYNSPLKRKAAARKQVLGTVIRL